jgi:hypothetical protein
MKMALPGELRHLLAAEVAPRPGSRLPAQLRGEWLRSPQLAAQDAAGLQHPARLLEITQHNCAIRNVLENGERVDEIEVVVRKRSEAVAGVHVNSGAGYVLKPAAGNGGHLFGNVHSVDLTEMAAHREHQTSRTTADLKSAPLTPVSLGQPGELKFERAENASRTRQKFPFGLLPPVESGVIEGILPSPAIPVLTHLINGCHSTRLYGIPTPRDRGGYRREGNAFPRRATSGTNPVRGRLGGKPHKLFLAEKFPRSGSFLAHLYPRGHKNRPSRYAAVQDLAGASLVNHLYAVICCDWSRPVRFLRDLFIFLLIPNSESTNIGIKPGRQLPPKRD